jgi:hypothetical protein
MTAATTTARTAAVTAPRAVARRGFRAMVKSAVERMNNRERMSTDAMPRMRWY